MGPRGPMMRLGGFLLVALGILLALSVSVPVGLVVVVIGVLMILAAAKS